MITLLQDVIYKPQCWTTGNMYYYFLLEQWISAACAANMLVTICTQYTCHCTFTYSNNNNDVCLIVLTHGPPSCSCPSHDLKMRASKKKKSFNNSLQTCIKFVWLHGKKKKRWIDADKRMKFKINQWRSEVC